jgi:hypothetical protein
MISSFQIITSPRRSRAAKNKGCKWLVTVPMLVAGPVTFFAASYVFFTFSAGFNVATV